MSVSPTRFDPGSEVSQSLIRPLLLWVDAHLAQCPNSVLNVKVLEGTFNLLGPSLWLQNFQLREGSFPALQETSELREDVGQVCWALGSDLVKVTRWCWSESDQENWRKLFHGYLSICIMNIWWPWSGVGSKKKLQHIYICIWQRFYNVAGLNGPPVPTQAELWINCP